jgi:PAS domain S-box-containing protein
MKTESDSAKSVGLDNQVHSDEVYRNLLDAAPDAVVVVGQDGGIVLVNVQAERMFGRSREQLVGQKVEILIPERFRSGHVGHRTHFFGAAKVRPMGSGLDLFGCRSDGSEFPIEISLSPLSTGGGMLVSAIIRDVTDRKHREMELRRLREEAEAASSAKSEFLSSMSHELRTPLNAILGFAQLLQRDKKEPLSERHRERLDHILKGGEHLLRLIDEVLDLSRIEAGRTSVSTEPFGVAEVLSEVKATLDPMATRAQIAIEVAAVPQDLPHGLADRTRFKQVLVNFGSNAIKYGRKLGRAVFAASLHGQSIRITVTDDGMGIPEDKQDKIFQPFHRAGQETGPIEGTGIGLAISKRLAELMGGSVGFSSVEARGSQFWIEIPSAGRDQATRSRIEERPVSTLSQSDNRSVIVYIEDNPSNIAFMEDLLGDFDSVDLITAPTAEIGLELVRAKQPSVVIMDINLPGMSGLEATRQLHAWPETCDIPVIALSAAAMVRDQAKVEDAGFYRYLTKPVQVDELIGVLEELLVARPTK